MPSISSAITISARQWLVGVRPSNGSSPAALSSRPTVTSRGPRLSELRKTADAIVTSYALLRLDIEDYADDEWSGLILDEAQYTKNHQSQIYQCARKLPAKIKLAITGTPLENNLMELWSLLSITAPGLFPNPDRFKGYYVTGIEKRGEGELLAQLKRRIKPLMLRRTKERPSSIAK